jgi:hypothetical protein
MIHSLMELSSPWEAPSCEATQEFPRILWKLKVHYRVHESLPLAPVLSQINPIHTISSYVSKIHFNVDPHISLGFHSGLFPSGFPTNILYAFFSPIRDTCPADLILLDLIILIILGEVMKLLIKRFLLGC